MFILIIIDSWGQLGTFKGIFWFEKTDGWNQTVLTWDHSPSTQTPTHSSLLQTWLATGLLVSSQFPSWTILLLSRIQWTARLCTPDRQNKQYSKPSTDLQLNLTFPPGDTVPRGTGGPGALYPGVASLQTAGPSLPGLPHLGWLTDGCWEVFSHVGLRESDDALNRPELEASTAGLGTQRPGASLPDQGRVKVTRVVWTNINIKHGDFSTNWREEIISILSQVTIWFQSYFVAETETASSASSCFGFSFDVFSFSLTLRETDQLSKQGKTVD